MRVAFLFVLIVACLLLLASCQGGSVPIDAGIETGDTAAEDMVTGDENTAVEDENMETGDENMTKMLYQGHASFRLTSKDGTVVYVDPYAGDGYDIPADIILVTHQHQDHNQIKLVTQNPGCVTITEAQALEGGKHNTFSVKGIGIEAVLAQNKNHDPKSCVGYIIDIDGIKVYAAGDTSKTSQMASFADKGLGYALLPCDGIYNMDVKEAAECAEIIGAKHNIPIHMKPGELFDMKVAESFDAPNRLIVEAGEEIVLVQ
ncbi:MAG: MBL fold metallo-hydrolase [Clostridiales bacterium]|nr:MBL fold metallo-hydrolase [Clostridiales bacterium]